MAEITSLSELTGEGITEDQIKAMLTKIDIAIHNVMLGNGDLSALPIDEMGLAGIRSDPTRLLAELRRMREMYSDLLIHPEKRGEVSVLLSQYDNPNV